MAGSDVLVWLDMEMTGLDPARERIIEIATILTDGQLVEIATGPELVIHQPDEVLAAMDDWNKTHHGASGLTDRVRASTITEQEAEAQTVAFINAHVAAKDRPVLAGNSIHQDRRFVRHYMPLLEKRLHYRMVDVSTVKELARRWYSQIAARQPAKKETHRAQGDIRESIEELRYYKRHVFAAAERAPRLDHVALAVRDPQRSRDWYVEHLGFAVEFQSPDGAVIGLTDRADLTLILSRAETSAASPGLMFSIQVADVDAKHRELVARGVRFVHEPKKVAWGYGAELHDPDGYRLGLWDGRSMSARG
ncbi:MAG TPA: oligoribonuclease [Kofleriaceae bacterium]|nr:oligoribonuclease [Kofleriaceae bacterium]